MAFTADQIQRAGHYSLDAYLRNKPIDQVVQDRPLLAKLMANKKAFPGGKQYVVENIRKAYDTNFDWYNGDAEVSYNKRDTVRQAQFAWRSAHDGFTLNEDELFQNGITVIEGKVAKHTEDEANRLTDVLQENVEALREGFEQKFDYELHLDGTQDTDALGGLDSLISTDPTTGTMGGLDRAVETYWRNYTSQGIVSTTTSVIDEMEKAWRSCTRHGGQPDFILAGEDFIDAFRAEAKTEITRYLEIAMSPSGNRVGSKLDPSSDLFFHGVQIIRDPAALDIDANLSPTIPWQKRLYMLNSKTMKLRPAQGHDMITRNPPRIYNRYAYYWGLTWKGALTCNKPNGNAVLSIA